MASLDFTACRGGAGKRPAFPTAEMSDDRHQKRAKDTVHEEQLQTLLVTAAGPSRTTFKRSLEEEAAAGVPVDGDGCRRGSAAGRADGSRVLQASDLENSVASISGALRWRSPVKPHKMPRLHGPQRLPGAPTAVRGIVDVGTDADTEDEPQERQQQQPSAANPYHHHHHQQQQQQQLPAAAGPTCALPPLPQQQHQSGATSGGPGQPQAPAAQAAQQQHEWGRLFSALSLGGPGRGSQRTDPVWAAATNNRAPGGGGSGGAARSWVSTAPGGPIQTQTQLQSRGQTGSSSNNSSGGGGGGGGSGSARAGPGADAMDSEENCRAVAPVVAPALAPRSIPVPSAAPSSGGADSGGQLAASGGAAIAGACSGGEAPASSAISEPAVCEAMEASPTKVTAAEDQPSDPAAEQIERLTRRSGGGGSGGGFLAQEAWRLLAGSGTADRA
ncbi:hypothetical protein PLESTB_000698700 [Pleodorina starrii]|uniref:Uncharacterized protein n=1 Tax=Pleodorina starrii TaxID=330485 RepID=A0A9W6BJ98_9CHLO|nr:hypothetical protein PLESTM_001218100 [Pleodorina starrii]GLC53013.1 hypothetical protein PLESTB_000698700 [Pleodorina starrii]GLC65309.1 hypothetical protein PLESTF_000275000 [Pleodorina starrii]